MSAGRDSLLATPPNITKAWEAESPPLNTEQLYRKDEDWVFVWRTGFISTLNVASIVAMATEDKDQSALELRQ